LSKVLILRSASHQAPAEDIPLSGDDVGDGAARVCWVIATIIFTLFRAWSELHERGARGPM
jgi:hypothetical protein